MTAIWLLSTKGRPKQCQEVLDACHDTGMTSPGLVYVDEDTGLYDKLKLPKNWKIHKAREWGSLQASMQHVYERYPNATQYGWLADDTYPRSPGWDTYLEAAAGDWCLSYARDLWLSESERTRHELESGTNLSSGLCWGGELVRAAGWWALPGTRQAGIDTAWCAIIEPLGLGRFLKHIVVEHKNYRTGKREMDEVDSWVRDGDDYISRDIVTQREWQGSKQYRDLVKKIGVLARVEMTTRQMRRMEGAFRDGVANANWYPQMPAVRLKNLVDSAEVPDAEWFTARFHPHPNP